jgi:hypothetical protein
MAINKNEKAQQHHIDKKGKVSVWVGGGGGSIPQSLQHKALSAGTRKK